MFPLTHQELQGMEKVFLITAAATSVCIPLVNHVIDKFTRLPPNEGIHMAIEAAEGRTADAALCKKTSVDVPHPVA
jgi:hypothetical protein